jgi:hypothetical protein
MQALAGERPVSRTWQADWAFGYGYPFYTFFMLRLVTTQAFFTLSWAWITGPQPNGASIRLFMPLRAADAALVLSSDNGTMAGGMLGSRSTTVFALTHYHQQTYSQCVGRCWAWLHGWRIPRRRGGAAPPGGPSLGSSYVCWTYLSHNAIALWNLGNRLLCAGAPRQTSGGHLL